VKLLVDMARENGFIVLTNDLDFNGPSSLLVAAAVWIFDGTVSQVNFYANETLIGTATQEPFEVNWSSPSVGAYQLTAEVVDSTNASTASAPIDVTIAPPGADLGTLGAPIADPPGGVYGCSTLRRHN
jgi:hypothetical protein